MNRYLNVRIFLLKQPPCAFKKKKDIIITIYSCVILLNLYLPFT